MDGLCGFESFYRMMHDPRNQPNRHDQSPPRVIFVPFIDGFGGVERLTLALSRYLYQQRIPHLVLCNRDSIGLERFAEWPLRVVQLNVKRHPLLEAWSLRAWVARHLTSFSRDASFLVFDLKGAFYAGACRHPFVLHLTDPPSLLAGDISKNAPSIAGNLRLSEFARPRQWIRVARAEAVHRLNTRGARKANDVIVMTERIAAEVEALYDVTPIIIRPGVSALPLREREARCRTVRFLSVSRLEDSKRISWILRALSDLEASPMPLSAEIDWKLDVVGDGPASKPLQELTQGLGLSNRVVFHGRVSDQTLEDVYGHASLFIMPAVQGYGLPALEALYRHIPVIAHSASGVSEILANTPWVEMLHGDKGADLSSAIVTMIQKINQKILTPESLPWIPVDSEWAAKICEVCKWVGVSTQKNTDV